MDAAEWRAFYQRERAELGDAGLARLVATAPHVELPPRGALVFPHTRLRESGRYTAAVARALVHARVDEVLALGVLHQARRSDASLVARARAGDAAAVRALRRVHGPGAPGDTQLWAEEYSLDNFVALLHAAAHAAGARAPRVTQRFPFFTGTTPEDLPGIDELARIVEGGCALVATTDPVHHGAGYGTPRAKQQALGAPETDAYARAAVEEGFRLLARRDYAAFAGHAAEHRSDFRDNGPVLAALMSPPLESKVLELTLVDYAETLNAAAPTWVAATLSVFHAQN